MYNPFNKEIEEIEYEDLEKLIENNVSEGWFVEYKGSFPKNKKIANSIASFANSEGGWYIVGIEEKHNESQPFEVVGFDLNDNQKPDDKITNIIKDNIDPIPYFETKIVEIPENKVILVVQVFEGHDVPYICDGRIYIRAGETTKDLPIIKDRYQFEKLLDKKHEFEKNVNSFMNNNFFMDDSFNQPYLEFYIYVNNPKNYLFDNFYSTEFFEKLKENFNSDVSLLDDVHLPASIKFDNISASVGSYILRHIYDNPIEYTGLTLELFENGHIKLILPFVLHTKFSLNEEYDFLDYYDSFIPEDTKLQIIDLVESIISFQIILAQYKRLLNEYGCEYDLFIKYKFKNFDGITPYIDSDEYMEFITNNGLSINLKTSVNIPYNGYLECKFNDFDIAKFAFLIVSAIGVPLHLREIIANAYSKYIKIKSKKE